MRVTVGTVVGLMASGHTPEEILKAYPYLENDDIYQALAYAAWRTEEAVRPPRRRKAQGNAHQDIEVPLASA